MIEISDVKYERYMNFADGMMYCQLLIIDGKNDWRLPTAEELHSNRMAAELYWVNGDEGYGYQAITKYRVRPVRDI